MRMNPGIWFNGGHGEHDDVAGDALDVPDARSNSMARVVLVGFNADAFEVDGILFAPCGGWTWTNSAATCSLELSVRRTYCLPPSRFCCSRGLR